ncbi:MAG: phosphate ABC transporter substrate-binding protein [Armatimonadota bacterium]|nr:phosphate ABC transporter substrate-binding protein [Armatimonadota bacterium]
MKMHRITVGLLVLAFLTSMVALVGCPPKEEEPVEPMMTEPGEPGAGPVGEPATIDQIGSTTVLPIAEKWAQAFHEKHANVEIDVAGGGSGTGIKALIDGTADIADASRPIKDKEKALAEENGITPVEHVVAYDGIAAVVHPDNPVGELSIEQLSDIFCGEVTSWDELGVSGMGDIIVVSRDSASGTYESWKDMVVSMNGEAEDRDYDPGALKKGSNKDVRSIVAQTKGAIGYMGLGYIDSSVKPVPVIPMDGGPAVEPTSRNVQEGSYPVSRKLYMYTDGQPSGAVKDYLEWGMTDEGQGLVEEAGYVKVK